MQIFGYIHILHTAVKSFRVMGFVHWSTEEFLANIFRILLTQKNKTIMATISNMDVQQILKESAAEVSTLKFSGIEKPESNDVLCGRGGGSQNHIGNKEYRAVINANKCAYIDGCRKTKTLLVESIVKAVRMQSPPGRFLEKDTKSGLWNDIGDKRAFAKVKC